MSAEYTAVQRLLEVASNARRFVILPHNDPDPDAIASAIALQQLLQIRLGIKGQVIYHGIIGRAENRALVRYLGDPLHYAAVWPDDVDGIALVDTQPGSRNNLLPPHINAHIVLDHHPRQGRTADALFADVRPTVGATSTILFEYLNVAGVRISPRLATALFYGIKTDTLGLGRAASDADVAAYLALLPQLDAEGLFTIEHAQVPPEYFRYLVTALTAARLYGEVLVTHLGILAYPDLVAEMADLLSRLQGVRWVICIGQYHDTLIVSVRGWQRTENAARLVKAIVDTQGTAGGHDFMAAGHIPLGGRAASLLVPEITQRALQHLKIPADTPGKPLI
ncbi:MAG: DHH family phosphoesterase [Anaerolineae bacterium]